MNIDVLKKVLPPKLYLDYVISLNTHLKTKEDPISFLLNDYREINSLLPLEKSTKVFYFNKIKTHNILYDSDEIIEIKDRLRKDLSFDFYLSSLIDTEPELINYKFLINYVKEFSKIKKYKEGKYLNLIKSIITIKYINNYQNSDLDEDIDSDGASLIKKESENWIQNHISFIKENFPELKGDNIYEMSIEKIYIDIIIYIIKNNKLFDYDFCYDIIEQIDLDLIDIQFMESETKFNKILEILDTKNDYIKNYIIKNFEDIKDENKINCYYILMKYFFKSSIYIYYIPLLFQVHKKIIEFIKTKDFSSITFEKQSIKERFEYVIKAYSDLDYYYYSIYLNKISDITNYAEKKCNWDIKDDELRIKNDLDFKNINIKKEILNKSIFTFDVSMGDEKEPVINNINIIYGENNKITYEELLNLKELNNFENKYELNKNNFSLFILFLNNFFFKIGEIISNYKINEKIKLKLEFESNQNNINAYYSIFENQFNPIKYKDEDILGKKLNELNGFKSLNDEIIQYFDIYAKTFYMSKEFGSFSTALNSKILSKLDINISTNDDKNNIQIDDNNNNTKEKEEDLIDFELTKFINKVDNIKGSLKFFVHLQNDYFLSYEDEKEMILYNKDFKEVTKISNLEDNLCYITEKESENKNIIEIIACYLLHIYLIKINLKDKSLSGLKKYEIPKKNILFIQIYFDKYILSGLNNAMIVHDLFNDKLESKNMNKLSNNSYKSGYLINNKYIALISNSLIPGGNNEIAIFNLSNNKMVNNITKFSPNITENGIEKIELKDNDKLLFSCKKYNSYQKNGILIVDINSINEENDDELNFKFYDTNNFEVNCFCQILIKKINLNDEIIYEGTIFFFAGGFDLDKRIGSVRLYKFKKENSLEIKYLQDIDFYDFDMPVNTITELKESGEIIITTADKGIYRFSKPNLNLYAT